MTIPDRHYSLLDQVCLRADGALRALSSKISPTQTPYPAAHMAEPQMTPDQRKHAAGLMRVNHAGEVCAQALYHGQALVTRSVALQTQLKQAAMEEGDHLFWCNKRLDELGSHTSYLNPLWYAGSFAMGVAAGCVSDECSLGFVAETESQVVKHLENHLKSLPEEDKKSLKILHQMQADEAHHRDEAIKAGAKKLPEIVRKAMGLVAKVMVKTAYWI